MTSKNIKKLSREQSESTVLLLSPSSQNEHPAGHLSLSLCNLKYPQINVQHDIKKSLKQTIPEKEGGWVWGGGER